MLVELLCSKCKDKMMVIEQQNLMPTAGSHLIYCCHCYNILRNEKETIEKCMKTFSMAQNPKQQQLIVDIENKIEDIQILIDDFYDRNSDDDE